MTEDISRRFPWLGTLAPLLFYMTLAAAFFTRDVSWKHYIFGYGPDPISFVWFLNWWPFAITHGLNPFICRYVWFPHGFNFAWATAVPTLAILVWPITALCGPVLSFNILTIAAPALTAWSAFLLGRELTRNWSASLVCGFLFGFSAPEYHELLNELNLDSIYLIPLILLLCVLRVRDKLSRTTFVLSLSLILIAQLGISTEVLATLCILGAIIWLIFVLFSNASERKALWRLAVDIALTAPLTIVLSAPFLYYLIKGIPDVPTALVPFWFGNDTVKLIFPVIPIHPDLMTVKTVLKQVAGFTPASSADIGIPILLIMTFYFSYHIRTRHGKALLASIFVIVILSLGDILHFNGRLIAVKMPWLLFAHIPVIRGIAPDRLIIYAVLCSAIVTGFWLAEADTMCSRFWRFALAGIACLFLVPAKVGVLPGWQVVSSLQDPPEFYWTAWPVQTFFTPAHVRATLGPTPNVIILPEPNPGPGMAWQLNAGLSFTKANGYVGFIPSSETKWGQLTDLGRGPPPPDFAKTFPAFCTAHHVDFVLIGPGTPPSLAAAVEALAWPHYMDDGIEVVKTPANVAR